MIPTTTKCWSFTAAQTDFLLEAVGATQRMAVSYAKATFAGDNTVNVSFKVGFGAATLPTVTDNSGTGALGIFMAHPGARPGGGEVSAKERAPFVGGVGEDLRMTCTVSTGGRWDLIVDFQMLEEQ